MDRMRILRVVLTAFFLLLSCRFIPAELDDLPVLEASETASPTLLSTDVPNNFPTDVPAENSLSTPQVFSTNTYEVLRTSGVMYAQGLSHSDWNSADTEIISLMLDIYEPIGALDNRPALILIHGGGFKAGSRKHSELTLMAEHFASRGWVCLSIDYRLQDDHGTLPQAWMDAIGKVLAADTAAYDQTLALYPASRDAKAAVRWLYANAEEYQINTYHIAVAGGSAGAYLSVMLGASEAGDFSSELTALDDPTLANTNLDQPSQVHTIIDFWGGPGILNAYETMYGTTRFDQGDAPILILHGDEDQTVDFSKAEELESIYQSTGVNYSFYPLYGYGHGAWKAKVNGMSLFELSFDFIVEQQGLVVAE